MTAVAALVADVTAAVLIAPIAAVVLPRTRRALGAALAIASSWLLLSAAFVSNAVGINLTTVVAAHVVLLTSVLAAAGIGTVLRAYCPDELDAIGVSLSVATLLLFGVFVTGRLAGDLPLPLLNAILTVNPVVATTAAARIDLFRTDLLYRVSPIPHLLFAYPGWQASSATFGVIASVTAAAAWWRVRTTRPVAGVTR